MPTKYNLRQLVFNKKPPARPGYGVKTAANRAAKLAATQFRLDARLLPAKAFSFPYHFHRFAEELFVVIEGAMMLRTPEGMRRLGKGDVVFFEKGPSGAHQLYNPGPRPCVYLDLRTTPGFDICEYPDSGKVLVGPEGGIYRKNSAVGYFDGEEDPLTHWRAAAGRKRKPKTRRGRMLRQGAPS